MNQSDELEVFFDGQCPLCAREIRAFRRLDRRGRVRLTDIAASGFDPARIGRTQDELLARIHAQLPSGEVITGVEVFRRMYQAAGFGVLVNVSRWPGVDWLLQKGYDVFARNRLRWTGRHAECSGTCARVRAS